MICKDRIALITGAGRGIGRAHALAFAAEGAAVIVNDVSEEPAQQVVDEIRAAGGRAIADTHDIADFDAAGALVARAVEELGGLDVVVNNAGILRDRMFVSSSVEEWDAVIRVHLRGHFCVSRHAAAYWRAEAKAGRTRQGRIVNTSSGAGLQGSVGQSAYAAAKGGIASLTLVQAAELGRYGVTANAIAPAARTRMTEGPFAEMMKRPKDGFDPWDPANISPLVVWLGSEASREVSGRIFEIQGGRLWLSDGYRPLPAHDKGDRYAPAEIGDVVARLIAAAPLPAPVYGA